MQLDTYGAMLRDRAGHLHAPDLERLDTDTTRLAHAKDFVDQLPLHLNRLHWPAHQLAEARKQGLRRLLHVAKARSSWYRTRLRHIDAATATAADLALVPPMTKQDLMDHFDQILTVSTLSRARAEKHLNGLDDDAYLDGQIHVVSSSGTCGSRGIFVYDWQGWLTCALTHARSRVQIYRQARLPLDVPRAIIAGDNATHMGFAMARTFARTATVVPATLSLLEIVSRLNALQPAVLSGLPSMLTLLAGEARAGRLDIRPTLVMCSSEPLLPEMRARFSDAWGCAIHNGYFTSEGPSASSCGAGRGMHLNDDVCIFEPVNEHGHPVLSGERAAKLYVTPLFNHVQPLIRYELSDEMTLLNEPCPCGSSMQLIDDVGGRGDDIFHYPGGVVVHPIVFASPLGRERHVVEYQVRQTFHGALIDVRADGGIDAEGLCLIIETELDALGIARPAVAMRIVGGFDRPRSGKLKRFFPLPAQ